VPKLKGLGFGPNFEEHFGSNLGLKFGSYNGHLFQFQAASNFGFANANTYRVKSDEFALLDVV